MVLPLLSAPPRTEALCKGKPLDNAFMRDQTPESGLGQVSLEAVYVCLSVSGRELENSKENQ